VSNAFIYTAVVVSLLSFIYIIPGLSLFPKFILAPRTAASIPFISISIVISVQYILSLLNQFNHQNVIIIIGIFSLTGAYRIHKILSNKKHSWIKKDFIALCLIIFSSIPLMIILGLDGFQHADEIYSWNTWAKKIYFNQTVTFESTLSPYPLALPSFIAFCYKFVGNIDYQLPIKFTFSLIYISTIFTIYTFASNKTKVGIFFITYIFVMLIIGVGYEYKKVYADTLMGGFLVTSLALLISLSKSQLDTKKNIPSISILIASVLLISTASLTKQGAMPWSIIFYPLLAYVIIYKNKDIPNPIRLTLVIPILVPILWYFIGGKGFNGNTGVIGRSMGERNYLEQLLYGFNESFINHPFILFFMIIVFIILFKKTNFEKIIISTGIILSTILILLFGAYETNRLYLHMILLGWLVIFAYGNNFSTYKTVYKLNQIGNSLYTYTLIGFLFIFWSISTLNYKLNVNKPVTNILDGREVQANWVIGKNGAEQYRTILRSRAGLWAVNSHVWGIYYGIDNFYRGQNLSSTDINSIANALLREKIGWIYSNDDSMQRLQDYCPKSVEKIKTADNSYNQTLYKISPDIIDSCIKKQK
jgi:hypothetical protein